MLLGSSGMMLLGGGGMLLGGGMLFGGGINEGLQGFIVSTAVGGSATDDQRECVREWIEARPEFRNLTVGPLVDAWHGFD